MTAFPANYDTFKSNKGIGKRERERKEKRKNKRRQCKILNIKSKLKRKEREREIRNIIIIFFKMHAFALTFKAVVASVSIASKTSLPSSRIAGIMSINTIIVCFTIDQAG